MKKLTVMMALLFTLLTGSAFAAQERPTDRGQDKRMHDRGMTGRRVHRRHRRARRQHVIEHRGEGDHRPPTP
jgi:hypothetical protein